MFNNIHEHYQKIHQMLAQNTGATTNETFLDQEETARKLAAGNPCLIPNMDNELYDCCGSDSVEATCTAIGITQAAVLGFIVVSWLYLLFASQWFRNQLLLSFTLLFQVLPGVWRTWFYLKAGWQGTSSFEYITIRSSDSGDFVVSLTAFAMYLYQIQQKYAKDDDPEFDYRALRKRLAIGFWIYFAVYSVYWGGFYMVSKSVNNLSWVDFATSAYFGFLIILYIVIGTKLIKSITKFLGYDDNSPKNPPGVNQVILIIVLMCLSCFLRLIFVSLQDLQKVGKIESISKDTTFWPGLMTIQCSTQLFAVAVVYACIYLAKRAEQAIVEEPESQKLRNDDYVQANHLY